MAWLRSSAYRSHPASTASRSSLGRSCASSLASLTDLALSNRDIVSLAGLEHATRLRSLNLAHNKIVSLIPLRDAGLPNPQTLVLDDNQISDLIPLQNLQRLVNLSLDYNPVTTLTPLSGLTGLQLLSLDRLHALGANGPGNLVDITVLGGMSNLTHLGLAFNKVEDVAVLVMFSGLQYLNLRGNRVKDLQVLTNTRLIDNDNDFSDASYSEAGAGWLGGQNYQAYDGDYRLHPASTGPDSSDSACLAVQRVARRQLRDVRHLDRARTAAAAPSITA